MGSSTGNPTFTLRKHDDGTVTLHAVINSEAGGFIQNAEPPIRVPVADAVTEAKRMTDDAEEWCCVNEVTHDQKGWNQSPCYFWRSMHGDLTKTGRAIRIPVKMVRRPLNTRNYL